MLNLAVLLENTARELPERDAVVLGDLRLTYAQIEAAANQVAGALAARGVGRGDRVALSCPNLPYFPIVYYGVLKAGATIVPLNVLLTEREIAYHLQDSGAVAYFCFEGTPELPMGKAGRAAFDTVSGCEHFVLIKAGNPSSDNESDSGSTSGSNADTNAISNAGYNSGSSSSSSSVSGTSSGSNSGSSFGSDSGSDSGPHSGSHTGVTTLAAFTAGRPSTFDTVQTQETDTAVILYTSGTTGRPKGAELTHSNMVQNALMVSRMFGVRENDVHLVTLPLFHSFGQTVQQNYGLASGATLILMPRFDPDAALGLMEREGVTVFAGVPTMYWAMLHSEKADTFDLHKISANLRLSISGGSALPLEVLKQFEERFDVPILEGYGLSETSPVATFSRADRLRKPGSIGLPCWGVEVDVVRPDGTRCDTDEPGEIVIRGHNVMKGYLGRPEATAEVIDASGWFHTGDVGRRDADGYFYIVDRTKDMIIRGGFNVYPREIEEVLMTHPAVSLAAVVGVPHDSHGEEVKAFVIRNPDSDITEQELVAWGKEMMAAYKYPRVVEFRDRLPMTATGKILKRELVARA